MPFYFILCRLPAGIFGVGYVLGMLWFESAQTLWRAFTPLLLLCIAFAPITLTRRHRWLLPVLILLALPDYIQSVKHFMQSWNIDSIEATSVVIHGMVALFALKMSWNKLPCNSNA